MFGSIILYMSALIALSSYIGGVACESLNITLECNGNATWRNTEVFGQFIDLQAKSILTVTCAEVRADAAFLIFQVHTQTLSVVLYQDAIRPDTSYTGTNVGMYSRNDGKTLHQFSIENINNVPVMSYVSIHVYNNTAPIPGGCNLVSPVEVDPTMNLSLQNNDTLIKLSVGPAKIDEDKKCGVESKHSKIFINHKFYRLYMSELNYDENEYFDNLRKMLTVQSIEENGEELPAVIVNNSDLLRLFSAYPGTGSVYAVIVETPFGKAAYVPTHTYGCTFNDEQEFCLVFNDVFTEVIYALIFFAGLFVCYFGHHFIKTEMFLMGLLAGSIVTYIVVSQNTDLESSAMSSAALLAGLFAGAIWWLLWWFYGIPFVSVMLPVLVLGFLASSLVMFMVPDGFEILTIDASYWCIFFILMLSVPISISLATLHANYLSCAVIGAFAAVYPIDFYVGSNLKYILINVIRRAVIPGFGGAYLATPFQWRDVLVLLIWIMLSVTGFLFHKYHNEGRAPFPPPPRNVVPPTAAQENWTSERMLWGYNTRAQTGYRVDERSPLLA